MFFYRKNQLFVRDYRGIGTVVGSGGARLVQIERETLTQISFDITSTIRQDDFRWGYLHRLCRIFGHTQDIAKARAIIERLLGEGEAGQAEKERLDSAARGHISLPSSDSTRQGSSLAVPRISDKPVSKPSNSGLANAPLVNSSLTMSPTSVRQQGATEMAITTPKTSSTHEQSKERPPPRTPSRKPRFTVSDDEDDDDSSSESEDSISFTKEDNPRPCLSKNTVAFRALPELVLPLPTLKPPPPEPTQIPVIKIEDDSDDDDAIKELTPETYRRENQLGYIPSTGTMRVSEVKRILDLRDAKAANLSQRVKVLEYALHYLGVSDFDITRMHAQVGEKGNWNAKFADILGRPRKGNERDGGPLTATDCARFQSLASSSRRS